MPNDSSSIEDIVADLGIEIAHRYRNINDQSRQIRCVCPFCGKDTLSIHVKTGKNYCWSANCEYSGHGGSFYALYAACKNISRQEAEMELRRKISISDYISGISKEELPVFDLDEEIEQSFNCFDQFKESIDKWRILPGCKGWGYYGSWIRDARGYDPAWFFSNFESWSVVSHPHVKRCMFSIQTESNVGWLSYSTNGSKPKTLNPPGSYLSRMLAHYNLMKRRDFLFVCEGFFTAARAIEAGFDAVAAFGTNLSSTQAALLKRAPHENIVIVYDYGAGEKAKRNALALHRTLRGSGKKIWWRETPFYAESGNGDKKGLDLDDIGTDRCRDFLNECVAGRCIRIQSGFGFKSKLTEVTA